MKLGDFQRLTHFAIDDPRMTTIGGFLYRLLDRLPQVGDSVTFEGIRLEVLAMDGHRIGRIRATRGLNEAALDPGEGGNTPATAEGENEPGGGPA
jgi:CBS domain containing-hemolysin-like protein